MEGIVLSMVIPVYNLKNYISRCLDSCLKQDVDKSLYEIVCVDDGSTDGTSSILDEYAEKYKNIRVVHTENQGVVKARNEGLSLAVGNYVWFVDGDDWIQENCLKYMMDIVISGDCDMLLFRERKVYEYQINDIDFKDYKPKYFDGGYESFDDHYVTGSGFYWFSKKIMDMYNIYFRPDVYYSDDTLFMAKFKARVKRMVITEAPIYYYLQRVDSVSHAVKSGLHCSCMYKLAKEYRELGKQTFENYSGVDINKKMKTAQLRAMQACMKDICFYCNDKNFAKFFIKMAEKEKLYPFGIDWKQFKIDGKQSIKADIMNWIFGFTTIKPYFWLCYVLMSPLRKKYSNSDFKAEDFDDNY